jgi:undecaprenyl-diphosphatase
MGAITLIVEATKDIIQSPRPTNGIVPETGFSFPSGHVTGTMVFFGLLTYFAWQQAKSTRTKALSNTLYIVIEALVGFSRVYLNVHWLSDILGGYLMGTFWLTLAIFLVKILGKNPAEKATERKH